MVICGQVTRKISYIDGWIAREMQWSVLATSSFGRRPRCLGGTGAGGGYDDIRAMGWQDPEAVERYLPLADRTVELGQVTFMIVNGRDLTNGSGFKAAY